MPDLDDLIRDIDPPPAFRELQRVIDETKAEIAKAFNVPKKMRARRRAEKLED